MSTPGVLLPEAQRRRREGWIILATGLAVTLLAVVIFWLPRSPDAPDSGSFATNAILVGLINLNVMLLLLFTVLVGRNLFKLIFERRQRIVGSHLRSRLVAAFVGVALVPGVLLFLVALVFVGNSIERWFNDQVEDSLAGSREIAQAYYEDLAETALGFSHTLAARLVSEGMLAPDRHDALKRFLEQHREEYQLDLVEVLGKNQVLARSRRSDLTGGLGIEPWSEFIQGVAQGTEATRVDPVGEADVVRAATPIRSEGKVLGVVVVDAYVPKSVVKRREQIGKAFEEYLDLKIQRQPIKTAYTITLALATVVVLFAATWVGFSIARRITVPIQRLAEGTRAVAQGNLDYRIDGEGEDEIGTLVVAFNHMTAALSTSRSELETRRRYLEILLANINAGVVSADASGRITTMNQGAESLLGMHKADCMGWPLDHVFHDERFTAVRQLVAELLAQPLVSVPGRPGTRRPPVVERQLTLVREDGEVSLLLSGTRLVDDAGAPQGLVLFLEDVTHLLRVQRMEAWREVARRIAHEIKNPLTPIQLSAQRLRRRYAAQLGEDGQVFDECTRTIIQQVDELKALVNEFAIFARMPAGEHTPQDLNRLLEEALVLYREGHREVDFTFAPATDVPVLELDREGLKRAIINVLDNAVYSCAQVKKARSDFRGEVEVRTIYDRALDIVRLEIADNGTGMNTDVKARVFEPYFSTKADGTGLGLAIVSAIVADHSGFIRVRDNSPRGSRFIMEFPVRQQTAALAEHARREAGARS